MFHQRAEQELGVPCKPVVEALTGDIRTCPDQDLPAQMGTMPESSPCSAAKRG